ncbi:ABC transporter substrate-binding protein [Ignatzschineria larvae DSM 13226]|uniref:ABC transporter substrate-binding protein n=1 Tax=Ignatzschineria larvae DSM 13226 TaxID=1111732 RepID=A0ABZ3BZZ9_9GAMM
MLRKLITLSLLSALPFMANADDATTQNTQATIQATRIVSASNPITQIISALNAEDRLVGIDRTSHTKPSLQNIPDIGYRTMLSSEGILSLKPDLILLAHDSGPINVLEQLQHSQVTVMQLPELKELSDIQQAVTTISASLNRAEEGALLNQKITEESAQLEAMTAQNPPMTGFFIMQEAQAGSPQVSGDKTSADKLLELLNINNAFDEDFDHYRAVSLESQLQKRADIVLIGKRASFDHNMTTPQAELAPFTRRTEGLADWPAALQPKCVFDVNMSNYLVFGIHIYAESTQLLDAIQHCMAEQ